MPDIVNDVAGALSLDYGQSVMSEEFAAKAPISVKVAVDEKGNAKAPGVRLRDFVPSAAKQAEMDGMPAPEPKKEPHRRGIVIERNGTFISGAEMRKRKAARIGRVKEIAKKLYGEKKSEIIEYGNSLKLTAKATKEEIENPNKKLRRALKIVKLGHPMTKSAAMEKAREMLHKQLRDGE